MKHFDLASMIENNLLFAVMVFVLVGLIARNLLSRGKTFGLRLIIEVALLLAIGPWLPSTSGTLHTVLVLLLGLDVVAMFFYSGGKGDAWHW